ncbi:hypothetical protein Krad_3926 [Kineococcus radiotolerans SRS30216 = ATCC BAA-149]|uniref:Uncharacterized protein n=1 Tax=Kineococcus radiotolerans (strain ATCC BAA-149 / DSM 14245 / SRS30216) TaxID=266940 RepID=A6WF00_KINRD|nr:hypothetical protein Krad_3926 [Kineococcus radiotolerans SRS30216 = ATCC BAA-149]
MGPVGQGRGPDRGGGALRGAAPDETVKSVATSPGRPGPPGPVSPPAAGRAARPPAPRPRRRTPADPPRPGGNRGVPPAENPPREAADAATLRPRRTTWTPPATTPGEGPRRPPTSRRTPTSHPEEPPVTRPRPLAGPLLAVATLVLVLTACGDPVVGTVTAKEHDAAETTHGTRKDCTTSTSSTGTRTTKCKTVPTTKHEPEEWELTVAEDDGDTVEVDVDQDAYDRIEVGDRYDETAEASR